MIKQCAIEPAVIRDWDRLRIFVGESTGISKGRVIARFPEDWLDLVNAKMCKPENPSILKLVNETLDRLKKSPAQYFASREGATYDKLDWLENALAEHERRRFGAIVAERNPREDQRVIRADEVHADEPRWKTETCKPIRREPAQFAEVVAPLLRLSREVLLIDRYFQPAERQRSEHCEVLREIARQMSPRSTERFEYHFCDESEPGRSTPWSDQEIQSRMGSLLPKGLSLSLIEWPRGKFHDRFVLTERGGINPTSAVREVKHPWR